eukprot:5193225-Prymnesium_polylepis.1
MDVLSGNPGTIVKAPASPCSGSGAPSGCAAGARAHARAAGTVCDSTWVQVLLFAPLDSSQKPWKSRLKWPTFSA